MGDHSQPECDIQNVVSVQLGYWALEMCGNFALYAEKAGVVGRVRSRTMQSPVCHLQSALAY